MQNVLEALVLHDYDAVFSIDISTGRYHFTLSKDDSRLNVPAEGDFDETNERFARDTIIAEDRENFLKETRLEWLLENVSKHARHSVEYRIRTRHNRQLYRNMSFTYSADKKGLIGTISDETEKVLKHIENARDLWLKDECIRFIVRYMCENFIIVNPETDVATTFVHDHRYMQVKPTYHEQIQWFADNIIVPEEREDYLNYFKLDSLMARIRENDICRVPFTVNYPDGRHNFVITTTLIKDPGVDEEKFYFFSSAQDITSLKRANETGERLLIKNQQDLMTGLYNRVTAEKLIQESLYSGKPEDWNTFLLLDIDLFKNFNDSSGHLVGDAVLRFMGKAMRETFRASDILCRWGGDEFVIFIPRLKDEQSLKNRLTTLQSRMKEFRSRTNPMPISLSIGGVIARNDYTLNTLFAKADEALYLVKAKGRDGIVLSRIDGNQETMDVS